MGAFTSGASIVSCESLQSRGVGQGILPKHNPNQINKGRSGSGGKRKFRRPWPRTFQDGTNGC